MNPIVDYIKENGFSYNFPISSSQLCEIFDTTGQEVRKRVNEARTAGIPICSCRHGYFYSENETDINKTIDSLQGRIIKQEQAIGGLQSCLTN